MYFQLQIVRQLTRTSCRSYNSVLATPKLHRSSHRLDVRTGSTCHPRNTVVCSLSMYTGSTASASNTSNRYTGEWDRGPPLGHAAVTLRHDDAAEYPKLATACQWQPTTRCSTTDRLRDLPVRHGAGHRQRPTTYQRHVTRIAQSYELLALLVQGPSFALQSPAVTLAT